MARRTPEWITRKDQDAHCDICGGRSHFRYMEWWRSTTRVQGAHYTYWHWWKRFKQTHRRCRNRQAVVK